MLYRAGKQLYHFTIYGVYSRYFRVLRLNIRLKTMNEEVKDLLVMLIKALKGIETELKAINRTLGRR